MIKHLTLNNPDGVVYVKLTLILSVQIDTDMVYGIEIISDIRHQSVEQMPALRCQAPTTDLVTRERGMIDQQTVHTRLLQQIATHRAGWSRSNNQDISFFHFGFLNIHSI